MDHQLEIHSPQDPRLEELLRLPGLQDNDKRERKRFKEYKRRCSNIQKRPPPSKTIIEPRKVLVYNLKESITAEMLKNHLSQFAKVVDVEIEIVNKPTHEFTAYVNLETNEDTYALLNLNQEFRTLGDSVLDICSSKIEFHAPGSYEYRHRPLSEREFDLDPADPTNACIHSLNDDAILKIFDCFPVKALLFLRVDEVCRRFQKLLHTYFKCKAGSIMKSDLGIWFGDNNLSPRFEIVSKVLILCSEALTSIDIVEFEGLSTANKGKYLRLVGQVCPSLESVHIGNITYFDDICFKDLIGNCRNLKSFSICERSFDDTHLTYLLTNSPTLETLLLNETGVKGFCFDELPNTMKVLHFTKCRGLLPSSLPHIFNNCSELKSFHLNSHRLASEELIEIGQKCPFLEDLSVTVVGENFDFSAFKNLKKLNITGDLFSVKYLLRSITQIEELILKGRIKESATDTIDFSVLPNLRVFLLPLMNWFSTTTMKTLALCPELTALEYRANNEHKVALIEIIRKCPKLTNLVCDDLTLSRGDINSFVEASRDRVDRLRFSILYLEWSACDKISKLEAKYDIVQKIDHTKRTSKASDSGWRSSAPIMQEDESEEEFYNIEEMDIIGGLPRALIKRIHEWDEDSNEYADLI